MSTTLTQSQPKAPLRYRDIVTSHLREDTRILASVLAVRKVFQNPSYDIFICIYSGLIDNPLRNHDLVTCLVVFKEEKLRIMFKLWTADILGNRGIYIETVIQRLKNDGMGPYHLVRNAKKWCKVPYTQEELREFSQFGISPQ